MSTAQKSLIPVDGRPDRWRYRSYIIKEITHPIVVAGGQFQKRYNVGTSDMVNSMPGAISFSSLGDATHAIDVYLAVDGDAELFWDLIQPFQHTVGEETPGSMTVSDKGRFGFKAEDSVIREVRVVQSKGNRLMAELATTLQAVLNSAGKPSKEALATQVQKVLLDYDAFQRGRFGGESEAIYRSGVIAEMGELG